MEAVKLFDIDIDLDQCSKLYDYGRAEYITRPPEGWDRQAITDASRQVDTAQDETTALKLKKMDLSLSQKHFFEKETSKNDKGGKTDHFFDDFSPDAVCSLPMRVLPVFKPGDVVQGQVHLEVVQSIEAEAVVLKLKGHAYTNIRIYHKNGHHDDKGEVVYVKERLIVWAKGGATDTDMKGLLSSSLQRGTVLTPGKYCFPFTFQLPADIRQSVPPLLMGKWTSDWAHIAYFLKATINKGKSMKRGNIISHRGVWIEKSVDIGRELENLRAVVEEKEQVTGIRRNGKIVCRASIPTHAYVRGSHRHIPLKLEVDNQSGSEISAVKAWVALNGSYRSKPNSWHGSKSISVKGDRVRYGAVASGMCPEFAFNLPLDFTEGGLDGNLIPAGTLDDCDIIDVYYEVRVQLNRKGLHRNMELDIPIEIGTWNSRGESVYPSLSGLQVN